MTLKIVPVCAVLVTVLCPAHTFNGELAEGESEVLSPAGPSVAERRTVRNFSETTRLVLGWETPPVVHHPDGELARLRGGSHSRPSHVPHFLSSFASSLRFQTPSSLSYRR